MTMTTLEKIRSDLDSTLKEVMDEYVSFQSVTTPGAKMRCAEIIKEKMCHPSGFVDTENLLNLVHYARTLEKKLVEMADAPRQLVYRPGEVKEALQALRIELQVKRVEGGDSAVDLLDHMAMKSFNLKLDEGQTVPKRSGSGLLTEQEFQSRVRDVHSFLKGIPTAELTGDEKEIHELFAEWANARFNISIL